MIGLVILGVLVVACVYGFCDFDITLRARLEHDTGLSGWTREDLRLFLLGEEPPELVDDLMLPTRYLAREHDPPSQGGRTT